MHRSKFTSCQDLCFLSLFLPIMYSHTHEGYTPLEVVYDMIWSHSEFIDVMRQSCDHKVKGQCVSGFGCI